MKTRRLIETIEVSGAKQVITIDLPLPGDAKCCYGIQAIIVGLFPSTRNVIPNFGEFSMEFNYKKLHPITGVVSYINPSNLSDESYHRPCFLPLDVALSDNRLVTGYYRDLGEQANENSQEFVAYKVKFIFHLQLS